MDFTVRTDLEIQFHSGLVVVVGRILILPANLILVPTPFVLVGLCRAEKFTSFDVHGLLFICCHNKCSFDK